MAELRLEAFAKPPTVELGRGISVNARATSYVRAVNPTTQAVTLVIDRPWIGPPALSIGFFVDMAEATAFDAAVAAAEAAGVTAPAPVASAIVPAAGGCCIIRISWRPSCVVPAFRDSIWFRCNGKQRLNVLVGASSREAPLAPLSFNDSAAANSSGALVRLSGSRSFETAVFACSI